MFGVGARTLVRRSLISTSRDASHRCVGAMFFPRPVLSTAAAPRVSLTSASCPRASWPFRVPMPGQQCMTFHHAPVVRGPVTPPSRPPLLHTCRSLPPRGLALPSTRRPLSFLVGDITRRAAVTTWVLNGPVGWPLTRGYATAANQWRKRLRIAHGGSMGVGLGAGAAGTSREIVASPQQTRGFWRLSNLKNSGIPVFFQVFYGTLLMIGMGVLLFTAMSLSAGAAVLFLLGYLAFRVAARRPGGVVNAMQHPMVERTQMGRMFRPLVELMADSSLFEGLRDIRVNIEDDVLHAINHHKELSKRYGDDFIAVGHHKMSMQDINGNKMVMLEFPVISTRPRELIVEVIAKQPRVIQEDVPDKLRWQYESVTVRPNDSPPVDLTDTVAKGAGKHIIIEATARKKTTTETRL